VSNYSWAKVWIEVIYDHKMANLSDHLWRRTIELILLAKELDPIEGHLPSLDEMAFKLRIDPKMLDDELNELAQLGITEQLTGGWFLPNFKDRQRKMTGAERVALHRERRKKREYNEGETEVLRDGNEDVTVRYTKQDREPATGEGNDNVTTRYREESKNRIEESKSKKRTNGTGPLPDIPESLATPAFLNAWGEYRQHRKEKRSKLTAIAAKRQLNKLEKWGPDRATAAIIHTLENGWLGIFEDKAGKNGQNKAPEPERKGGIY
jgi:hypothetical protein